MIIFSDSYYKYNYIIKILLNIFSSSNIFVVVLIYLYFTYSNQLTLTVVLFYQESRRAYMQRSIHRSCSQLTCNKVRTKKLKTKFIYLVALKVEKALHIPHLLCWQKKALQIGISNLVSLIARGRDHNIIQSSFIGQQNYKWAETGLDPF